VPILVHAQLILMDTHAWPLARRRKAESLVVSTALAAFTRLPEDRKTRLLRVVSKAIAAFRNEGIDPCEAEDGIEFSRAVAKSL